MKPILFNTEMVQAILDGRKSMTRRVIKDSYPPTHRAKYQSGDILWVRETWAPCATIDSWLNDTNLYVYRANYGTTEDDSFPPSMFEWKPSIHMPREAARIFLKVTNVSVERVQEITVDDCRLEGCCCSDCSQTGPHSPDCKCDTLFYNVWNDIYAKRGYGWETNPWVWVYEFERISKEEAERLEGMK